jgi:non-canonical poly(A) RNA polymerase PAPD5/7
MAELPQFRPNFLLSLPQNYRRRRRPDLELTTLATPGADDARLSASLLEWLHALSPQEREEACADENPWLVVIFKQMLFYKATRGDSVHSVDKDPDRDIFDCALQSNFLSKARTDPEISVKRKAEWCFEEHIRVWSVGDDWDTLAISSQLAADVDLLLELLSDISGGQAFTVPCRVTWYQGQKTKLWIRESPSWLSASSSSLAEYAAAALERTLWFKFWAAKKLNPRRQGDNQPFPHDSQQRDSYPRCKECYVDFWRELDKGKRLDIIGNIVEYANEYMTELESLERLRRFSSLQIEQLDEVVEVTSYAEETDRHQLALQRHIRDYNNPQSAETLITIGTSPDASASEFIDMLFTTSLDRISSVFDIAAKHVGLSLKEAYQKKMAEDLALLEEAEQVKKQGKKNREEIKTHEKLKVKKPLHYKKKRRLSDASAVSVSTTASAATSLSSHDEDEGAYARGIAVRLVEEAILSINSQGSKHQIPELPDEEYIEEKEEKIPAEWPMLPLPANKKKKKKKGKKGKKMVVEPILEVPPSSMVQLEKGGIQPPADRLSKDISKFSSEISRALEDQRPAREEVIDTLTTLCQRLFPCCHVQLFGSMWTGLALSSSDVDLVIISAGVHNRDDAIAAIRVLGQELAACAWVTDLQVIATASTPVVKFECESRGSVVKVDCSFDDERHTGTASSLFCVNSSTVFPALKDLALVLKSMLYETGLNCAFLGGLSSYQLVLWVVSFLQSTTPDTPGQQLLGFLHYFGLEFNPKTTGICVCRSPSFYPLAGPIYVPVVTLDPVCPNNNTTRHCVEIDNILSTFAKAYAQLSEMLVQKRKKGFIKALLKQLVESQH